MQSAPLRIIHLFFVIAILNSWLHLSYADTVSTNITQNGGTFTNNAGVLTIGNNSTANTLSLQNGATTSGIQTLYIGTSPQNVNGNLDVLGGSTLTVSAGTLIGFGDNLGGGANGNVTVSGAGSLWKDSNIFVGFNNGQGTILVTDLGALQVSTALTNNGSGTVTLDGGTIQVNGTVTNNGTLNLYDGTFNVNGGTFKTTTPLTVDGNDSADLPTLKLSNKSTSTLTQITTTIGNNHQGAVEVSGGSQLESANTTLGAQANGNGTLTVTGAGSLWKDQLPTIGNLGTGTLNVLDGAHSQHYQLFMGSNVGSDGTANVSGSGSTLEADYGIIAGALGAGHLNVTNGGTVSTYVLDIGSSAAGTLNVSSGGQVSVSADSLIGQNQGADGRVTISGVDSSINTSWLLEVGYRGKGLIEILGGGQVQADGSVLLGEKAEGNGEAKVSGSGSLMSTQYLDIGREGKGALNVLDGGKVTAQRAIVGTDAGSIGTATVSGLGSELHSTSTVEVGFGGAGSLYVLNGGKITADKETRIGGTGDSTDFATVSGAGSMIVSPGMDVTGVSGASLTISEGGEVQVGGSTIGGSSNANSVATVTGIGSIWSNTGGVVVGDLYFVDRQRGNADVLRVEKGGVVTVGGTSGIFISWGGTLAGDGGTIVGNVSNYFGTVSPGSSPGIMTIDGNYSQLSDGKFNIELAGLSQGTNYDYLHITGLTTLDGLLKLDFLDGFEDLIAPTDSFTILTSDGGLTGDFSNLDLNHRLNVRQGSFLVSYENNSVVLSDFVAVPEAGSLVLAAFGVVGIAAASRRMASNRS